MAGYAPKYPKILIDNSSNYPNAIGIRKEVTVEEWQDIMHHNHTSIEENKTDISLLKKKIDSIFAYLEKSGTLSVKETTDINGALKDNDSEFISIILSDNISTDEGPILIDSKTGVELDLNGKTLTSGSGKNNNIVITNSKVTLNNGALITNDPYDSTHSTTLLTVDEGGELEVNNVSISAVMENPVDEGQFGLGVRKSGKLTINDCSFLTGWYGITGNGNDKNSENGSVITINGGTITSTADFAIYHPQAGYLEINGGNIVGSMGALSMNNGTCVINGGTLMTTGDGDAGEWADGTSGQDPAIINLNGKYGPVSLTINGGTFITTNDLPIVIAGTKFAVEIIITGGNFSAKPNSEWIAEGYACSEEPNADGFYTVNAV